MRSLWLLFSEMNSPPLLHYALGVSPSSKARSDLRFFVRQSFKEMQSADVKDKFRRLVLKDVNQSIKSNSI